jgi:thioredoxin-dependent peroxiredoxin
MKGTTMLTEGAPAPDFSLLDQHGATVTLAGLKGHKALVYFYPRADTPGCTAQSCGLRDIAGEVGDTAIIGISPDQPEDQLAFDQKYSLGFPLLADPTHATADAYDVWGEVELPNGMKFTGIQRSAFLIDEAGAVERAWYKVTPLDTPQNLLQALQGS